jgi:hypothetical protein
MPNGSAEFPDSTPSVTGPASEISHDEMNLDHSAVRRFPAI